MLPFVQIMPDISAPRLNFQYPMLELLTSRPHPAHHTGLGTTDHQLDPQSCPYSHR